MQPALQPIQQRADVAGNVEGVLAGRLLSSPPPWILERVDVGGPRINSKASRIAERPRLGTDNLRHRLDQVIVKRGAHQNRLRETRRVGELVRIVGVGEDIASVLVRHAVESFVPPLVWRNAESWYPWRRVASVVELLLEREGGDEGSGAGFGRCESDS